MPGYHLAIRCEGTGTPLVFLHALGASSRYWNGRLGALAATHRCVLPDLLGFGQSPKPDDCAYAISDHLDALTATLAGETLHRSRSCLWVIRSAPFSQSNSQAASRSTFAG